MKTFIALTLVFLVIGCGKGDKGDPGSGISAIWAFHADDLTGAANLSSETTEITTRIGDIQLVRFSDGSSFVSISGALTGFDSNSDSYQENFAHSFFLPSGTVDTTKVIKFSSFASVRIRYSLNPSAETPSFSAVVDTNGDFGNNTDQGFVLTKQ